MQRFRFPGRERWLLDMFVMSCSYRGSILETVGETGAPADTVDGGNPTPPGIYKTL